MENDPTSTQPLLRLELENVQINQTSPGVPVLGPQLSTATATRLRLSAAAVPVY
jgi:hypothetical protein